MFNAQRRGEIDKQSHKEDTPDSIYMTRRPRAHMIQAFKWIQSDRSFHVYTSFQSFHSGAYYFALAFIAFIAFIAGKAFFVGKAFIAGKAPFPNILSHFVLTMPW